MAADFELGALSAAFYEDPFPYYDALRRHAPVKRLRDGTYFLTRYDDVMAVYKSRRGFSSDKKSEFLPKFGESPLYEHHTSSLVFNDPPLHSRVRRLIMGALTPRAIDEMRAPLIELVETLLDRMDRREDVDLVEDFAAAIPVEVIGNLLDVPHEEREPLRSWSLAILGALEPVIGPDVLARGNAAVEAFLAYLEGLISRRKRHPGDPQQDLLTRLIVGEANGEALSPGELLHNCIFLLNAGHETTTNLIGSALVTLAQHPHERMRLLSDPSLIEPAIEEVLRYESPNQLGNRIAVESVEIGGVTLPAGARITLCIGAANRDPDPFPDPQRFDVGRTPNRHVAFAAGIHACAGMSLARLEGQVAVSRFLARYPRYRIAGGVLRGGRARFRGFLRVPATLHG